MQHYLQKNYLRLNSGSKETKTSSNDAYGVARMHMMLIAQDNRPAALTLLPVLRVTRKHWRGG